MFTRAIGAISLAVLAGTSGLPLAHADIFTWVDASGRVNVSNLDPPPGAVVTNVIRDTPPNPAARDAEVRALAARVRQLEDEAETAKRQTPVQPVYQSIPPPPAAQYAGDWAPPPDQYASPPPDQYTYDAPPANSGCDPAWMNCGSWWGPGIYPANIVVLRTPGFRRFPPVRFEHHQAAFHPTRPPAGGMRPPAGGMRPPTSAMHPPAAVHRG